VRPQGRLSRWKKWVVVVSTSNRCYECYVMVNECVLASAFCLGGSHVFVFRCRVFIFLKELFLMILNASNVNMSGKIPLDVYSSR
jgi:hypothetical protein